MEACTIRKAAEADAPFVSEIAYRCWKPIYQGYQEILGEEIYRMAYPEPMGVKTETVCRAVREGRAFVAEIDGRICGFATFRIDGQMGVLADNAVDPEYKGRGIAGLLYERIFDALRARACAVVRVGTGLDNGHASARRAYEKMGFEVGLPSICYYKKL